MKPVAASFRFLLLYIPFGTTQAQEDMNGHLQHGSIDIPRAELNIEQGLRIQGPEPHYDRELHRSSIAQQYADLGQELGVDAQMHEQLIDVLVDLQRQGIERNRSRPAADDVARRKADAVTAKLTAIRTLIGDEGLDRYHQYMATRFARDRVRVLDDRLAPQDKLEPEKKRRLIELLAEYDEPPRDLSHSVTDASGMLDLGPQERQLIGRLDMVAANEEMLRRTQARNPELAARASQFLSPAQVTELTEFNEEGVAALARMLDQQRARLDPMQVATAMKRVAEAQGDRQTPLSGEITFEINLTIDEDEPAVMLYRRPNGTPATIEVGELSIEVTPTLLPRRSLRLAVVHFGELGGRRRQLDAPTSHSRYSGHFDEEPIEVVRTDVVHGRRKGHIVRTAVRVLE
jgi:hypothetical protein